jgi:DNA-binding CsgD family transcriptional regulator
MGRPSSYTPADDAQLRALFEQGLTRAQIAFVMGRTVKSLEAHMGVLKLYIGARNRAQAEAVHQARAVVRADRAQRRFRAEVRREMRESAP